MFIIIVITLLLMLFLLFNHKIKLIYFKNLVLIIVVSFLVVCIVLYPQEVFESAKDGIDTWFNIVFPALLPFFIGAELLVELGIIRFIGILLEPLLRPIFSVSGEGSFVFAMSITSGYPMGIKLATELRNEGIFTKIEAQRILSFCSTSGPLFMIGAVAIGMFKSIQLGIIISVSHYLGAITTGIIFRFYKFKSTPKPKLKNNNIINSAVRELWRIIQKNNIPLGTILGSAVKKSIETLLMIGGFIILFSVIIRLLTVLGFIAFISNAIYLSGISPYTKDINQAVISGLFEVTTGCKMLSQVQSISFVHQAILCTFIISWSGFSIHAQAASFISNTDLSIGVYLLSKILHAILSSMFVVAILPLTSTAFRSNHMPTFLPMEELNILPSWYDRVLFSSQIFIVGSLLFILIPLSINFVISFCKK